MELMLPEIPLTTEMLAHTKGWQLRVVRNKRRGSLHGEIKDIVVTDRTIIVTFSWLARNTRDHDWIPDANRSYAAHTFNSLVVGLTERDNGVIWFDVIQELMSFLPPGCKGAWNIQQIQDLAKAA